jgi:hypothetical protein
LQYDIVKRFWIIAIAVSLGMGCQHDRLISKQPDDQSHQTNTKHRDSVSSSNEPDASWREERYQLQGEFLMDVAGSPRSTLMINGELAVAHVTDDSESRRLQLINAVASTKQADTEVWKADPAHLKSPFYVEYANGGSAKSISIQSGTPIEVRRVFETLVAELQLTRPDSNVNRWKSTERDNLGEYTASYERSEHGRVTKHKVAYTTPVPAIAGKATPASIANSELVFSLGQSGEVLSAKVNEVVEVSSIQLRSGFSLTLEKRTLRNPDATQAPPLPSTAYQRYAMGQASVGNRQEQDRVLTTNLSWVNIRDLLHKALKAPERSDVRQRVAAMLRLQPELIDTVVQAIHGDPEIAKDLAGALVHTGSNESRVAVSKLISDPALATPIREYAAIFSAQMPNPSEQLLSALWSEYNQTMSPIRQVSGYACGSIIGTMHPTDEGLARQLLGEIISQYDATNDSAERVLILGILGNTGSATAVPVILRAARSSNISERAQAVRAVRFIKGEQSSQVVRQALRDSDVQVRKAALEAAKALGVTGLSDALQSALHKEPVDGVRLEMLSLLSTCEPSPKLRKTFAWAARHDKSASVREFAQRIEASGQNIPGGASRQAFPQNRGTNQHG